MKRLTKTAAYSLFLFLIFCSALLPQKSPKDKFTYPPLNKIEMPDVEEFLLQNGMRIFLIEDHQFPTIDFEGLVNVGSIYEPDNKTGLASITGMVLRTGGTKNISGDQLDKTLENLGAYIETDIGPDAGWIGMSLLKEDLDRGVEIMADLLMNAAFPEDKIELAKIMQRSIISRRNDDIWSISSREFNSLIYGKESPYARYPEYSTIDAISRNDITGFYKKYFNPRNLMLAVWGDFDTDEMKTKLSKAFGNWKDVKTDYPEKPVVDYKYNYTINFIQKPDVNQSHIQIGHIGGLLSDPDYPALEVLNHILNSQRMFKIIRSREGLTYAPWGYYDSQYDHPGTFSCGTQTKSQSTVYAIKLMLAEVKRICEEEVTAEELALAKDSYMNRFVFNFDSREKIVKRMMNYAFYGYPLDFIERVRTGVESVTKQDVLNAAKKHLRPDALQILVVGKKEDFDEPLSVLGNVNEIDISIPEPAALKEN